MQTESLMMMTWMECWRSNKGFTNLSGQALVTITISGQTLNKGSIGDGRAGKHGSAATDGWGGRGLTLLLQRRTVTQPGWHTIACFFSTYTLFYIGRVEGMPPRLIRPGVGFCPGRFGGERFCSGGFCRRAEVEEGCHCFCSDGRWHNGADIR